jgi:segregation and condensation protein A
MENPTFHLDAVVKSKEALEDFDGPLSLILLLLARNRVEIKDIKIAAILEQYLDYLARMERMDLEIASEFITMASHLMYVKAKTLLKGTEKIEEMESLIDSLEELRRRELLEKIKAAAALLEKLAERGEGVFTRAQEPLEPRGDYAYSHEPAELIRALCDLLGREADKTEPAARLSLPARPVYPVGAKSEEILLGLRDGGELRLDALFAAGRDRSELAATLMAILELYRSERISLEDTENGIVVRLKG